MFNWLKYIFRSKEEIAIIKELEEEEKDLKEMETALKELKNKKFRIEKIQYNNRLGVFSDAVCIYFFAQIKQKCGHNNYKWQKLKGYYYDTGWCCIDWTPFESYGTPLQTEEEALKLIEEYKKQTEENIRKEPERKKLIRKQIKEFDLLKKNREIEYEKTKPIITHKLLK